MSASFVTAYLLLLFFSLLSKQTAIGLFSKLLKWISFAKSTPLHNLEVDWAWTWVLATKINSLQRGEKRAWLSAKKLQNWVFPSFVLKIFLICWFCPIFRLFSLLISFHLPFFLFFYLLIFLHSEDVASCEVASQLRTLVPPMANKEAPLISLDFCIFR